MDIKRLKNIHQSEKGYAAFVVTLVTMIVVSLIVIAFATDSRIEQKNSLANNLASQAYYAAESGINDAYAQIVGMIDHGATPPSSTNGQCTNAYSVDGSNYLDGTSANSSNAVLYSCLIVDTAPNTLAYQDIVPGNGQVVELTGSGASDGDNDISYITINWQSYQAPGGGSPLVFSSCPPSPGDHTSASFPPFDAVTSPDFSPSTCSAPVLQLDMVSSTALDSNPSAMAQTVFLEPDNSGSLTNPVAVPGDNNDYTYYVACKDSASEYACTQTIAVAAAPSYYLHFQTFYQPGNITISAENVGAGAGVGQSLNLGNAQILIDSTGEAGGQLKRLQERVCYGQFCNNGAPVGAIQSTECIDKDYSVYPNSSTAPSGQCSKLLVIK